MTKYTKRQYRKDLEANAAEIEQVNKTLDDFNARAEAGENINAMSEAWEAAFDRLYELEGERRDIERRFSMRNWTWQDHSFASLVSANID